jgi:hypothetical protein
MEKDVNGKLREIREFAALSIDWADFKRIAQILMMS